MPKEPDDARLWRLYAFGWPTKEMTELQDKTLDRLKSMFNWQTTIDQMHMAIYEAGWDDAIRYMENKQEHHNE